MSKAEVSSQCIVDSLFGQQINILDQRTRSVRMAVRNARIDTIGGLNQGVCGVRLNFAHSNLGDLNMTLISPNGDSIILVGPTDKAGTIPRSVLFPVLHDITFRLNFNPGEMPDPGFPMVWTNQNIDWGQPGFPDPYEGYYLPFNGNLVTDLEGGSINGIWELIIEDAFINDIGVLFEFEIEFCVMDNIECAACESRSGNFDVSNLVICDADSFLLNDIYNTAIFNTTSYSDHFLIYDGQDFVNIGDTSLSSASINPGTYTIYSINILSSDLDTLASMLPSMNQTDFRNMVDSVGGYFCIDRSEPVSLTINALPPATNVSSTLCAGEFVVLLGDTIREAGIFVANSPSCDSVIELTVEVSDLVIGDLPDTIYFNCDTDTLELAALYTSTSDSINIRWENPMGELLGIDSILRIGDIGRFGYTIDDGICSDFEQTQVLDPRDTMILFIEQDFDQLNCASPEITFLAQSNFNVTSYVWSAGIDTLSRADTLLINEAGNFSIVASDGNGCEVAQLISATSDLAIPQVSLQLDSLNCSRPQANIQTVTSSNLNFNWLDQDMNGISTDSDLITSVPGDYSLIVTGENQCDTTLQFSIPIDTAAVEISDVPSVGFLTCARDRIDISPTTNPNVTNNAWIFNGQILQTGADISLTTAGQYQFIATADNQCSDTVMVAISDDTMAPSVTLSGDDLSCSSPQSMLTADVVGDDWLVSWGSTVDEVVSPVTALVSAAGLYTVGVIDTTNECIATDTISVSSDASQPSIDIQGDTLLTCSVSQLLLEDRSTETTSGEWITDNNDTLPGKSITISEPGAYRYRGIGGNGCDASEIVMVTTDTSAPVLNLPSSIFLDCNNPTSFLSIPPSPDIARIEWIQDAGVIEGNNFMVNTDMPLEVVVQGVNGCTDSYNIPITSDFTQPDILLSAGIIDCNTPEVHVVNNLPSANYNYNWTGNFIDGQSTDSVSVIVAGAISVEVTDTSNGCTNTDMIQVLDDFVPPTFDSIIITRFLRCDFEVGRIFVEPAEGASVVLIDPDGNESETMEIPVTQGGDYVIRLIGENGCIVERTESIIDTRTSVDFEIDTDYNLNCLVPSLTVGPDQFASDVSYTWIYENGDMINAAEQVITDEQLVSVYAIDSTGCDTLIQFNIDLDTIAPLARVAADEVLNCEGESISIRSDESDLTNYALEWNGPSLTSIVDQVNLSAESSGVYNLTVVNRNNGCVSMDSIALNISDDPLRGVELDIIDESCLGASDGEIIISSIIGGVGDINVSIGGQSVLDMQLTGLTSLNYNIELVDVFGCTYDTSVMIMQGADYIIDLGGDLSINRGNSVIISPSYSGDVAVATEFLNASGSIEFSLDSILLTPVIDQAIFAISESENGCIATDTVFIEVMAEFSQIGLYVPNVMALNTSMGNDIMTLELTDDIVTVSNFSIFDRWGQRVFFVHDLDATRPTVTWDGTHNGEMLTSGVYVYSYEIITTIDARRKIISGDITILR